MRSKILLTSVLTLALASFGQAALAAESGFYFSGKIGSTNVDGDGFDDSDLSLHPSIGYDFTENWAIEVGYDNWGEPKDSCGSGCTIKLKDADGFNARLVGTLPINDDWDVFGSVGWQHWSLKLHVEDMVLGSFSDSDNGDDVVGGVGAKWKVGETFSIKGGFDYFQADDVDISTWYIGGEKKFH